MLLLTFKMFWPFFLLFLSNFFVNFSSVGCDCNPISYDYETPNHLSTGAPVGNAWLCQKPQSAFAGTIYRKSIRNEWRKMWTIQDFVVMASRLPH